MLGFPPSNDEKQINITVNPPPSIPNDVDEKRTKYVQVFV